MSSEIYTLKLLLLQDQLDLEPNKGIEIVWIFRCSYICTKLVLGPIAAEATINDLWLYNMLLKYEESQTQGDTCSSNLCITTIPVLLDRRTYTICTLLTSVVVVC